MSKRSMPWLKWYPADWLSDSVAGCSLAARGLWLEMLCIMHASERYGHLEADGKPIPDEMVARRCRCASVEEYRNLLAELFSAGVPSRTSEGIIYNRRMVRDQQERDADAKRQRRHREQAPCHASVTPMSQEEVRSQKSESEKEKKTPAAKTTPPPDSRFQPFFEYAYESYRAKHGQPPIWTGKDRNGLKTLLRGAPATALPLERLTGLWDNFTASTEPFTAKQGDSLAYFCSNLDKFSSGPIFEGGSNGKLVSFAEQRSQKNSAAIQRVLGRAEEASGDIRRALPPAHN